MRIIIIGFMGCGKSTIAKALAHELGFKFWDIDTMIEEKEGKTIAEIFINSGETYFRNLESNFLQELSTKKYIVVAAGGGTPCTDVNMHIIKSEFISVFLNVQSSILIARLKKHTHKRPLLATGTSIENVVETLLPIRMKYYSQATIILDVSTTTTKTIVANIISEL